MDTLLYIVVRSLVGILQTLPLTWVARIGRLCGALAYHLDARHRRVAMSNLTMCFAGEKTPQEIEAIARENFRRLGENYCSAVKTAAMSLEEVLKVVHFEGEPTILAAPPNTTPASVVIAIGHFGNFEIYARFKQYCPTFTCATTYRGLRQKSLSRLMQSLREQSGCTFFERRSDAAALKAWMNQPGVMLGLLADQRAAVGGIRVPFLGHDCATSAAPAVFALRYHCRLHTAICFRIGLARWKIETGPEIPTHENGVPRPTADIMRDVNATFEAAVRRDPANWFWVHDRWKKSKRVDGPESKVEITEPDAET